MAILGSLQVRLGIDATSLTKEMSQVTRKFQGPLKKMQRSLRGLSSIGGVAGGAGLTLGLNSVLKQAADFETQMNGVQAILQPTSEGFEQLRKQAKELSGAFDPTEIGQAQEILARNGLELDQILGGATASTLDLSKALKAGLAPAADLTTDVMGQFNKDLSELTNVNNILAGTAVKSKFAFDDLRLAFAQAGGVAGDKVSLEEFATSVAATAKNFASGSDAGTSFKTFLSRLGGITKESTDLMKKYGFSAFDASGELLPMVDIIDNLNKSFGHLSEKQRSFAFQKIFGVDAIRTTNGLMKTGSAGFRELGEAIGSIEASDIADAQFKGLNAELKLLRTSFAKLAIQIGDTGILSSLAGMVTKFTEFTGKLSESNPKLLKFGFIATGAVAVLSPLAFALSTMGGAVAALGPLFARVGVAFATLGPRIKLFTTFIARAGAIGGLRLGLAALGRTLLVSVGGPIGIAIAALSLFHKQIFQGINAVRLWLSEFVKTAQVQTLITGIKTAFGGLLTSIVGLRAAFAQVSSSFNLSFGPAARSALAIIGQVIQTDLIFKFRALKLAIELIAGTVNKLTAFVVNFASTARAAVAKFTSFWTSDTGNAANKIGQLIGALAAKIVQFFQALPPKIQAVWAAIVAGAKAAVAKIVQFFKTLPAQIASINWGSVGSDIINGITNGLNAGKGRALQAIRSVGQGMIAGFKRTIDSNSPSKVFHAEGLNITDGLGNGIAAGTATAAQAMQRAGVELLAVSQRTVEDVKMQFETLSHVATDGIFAALEGGKQGFKDWADDVIKQIARVIIQQKILQAISGAAAGGGAGGSILSGIANVFGGFRAAGGPVSTGKDYIVGEDGPEVFSPGRNGTIIPNHELGGGGQNTTINLSPGVTRKELAGVLAELEKSRILENVRNFAEGGQSAAALQY